MNERKLKNAFAKVREDMYNLYSELEEIKANLGIESKNLKEKNKEVIKNKVISKKDLEKEFNEFGTLVNEKMAMEIAGVKLEYQTDIARLATELDIIKKERNKIENLNEKSNSVNLNEYMDEIDKVKKEFNDKINKFKFEMTEEISKIYDKFFTEIVEIKQNSIKEERKKTKSIIKQKKKIEKKDEVLDEEKPLYESELTNKKSGKMKKIAKWLFVDEDEEIENIKKEVKKKK